MASIDERVVTMTMHSESMISGATRVLQALAMLKNSLNNLKGNERAFDGLASGAKRVDLNGVNNGLEALNSKLSALKVAAVAAFATLATTAVMAAGRMLKSFTIDPIMAGLHEYENELNTTAVIMANTGLSGEKGMAQIRAALGELNTYADKTIYSFEDMTSAIGKFTAAGVSLQDSVVAIKGLANLAALSGSTAQQAATAQYQLSQAIATGTIRLMDWNSVVNAGMGGKVFQQSLIQTARVHGISVDAMIKKNGSFRESLQEGWLSSKVLLETLAKFTGDLGKEQLKQMGYTDKQIAAIQKQAQAAVDAATKIRTVTQLISATSEAIQSAWAGVFRALFGNMQQATALWTRVGAVMTTALVGPVNALQKLISGWAQLGGREVLIEAIASAFKSLGAVLHSIGSAFRDVFPAMTADRLFNMTLSLKAFIDALKPSAEALKNIHTIFEGLFSGLKIGVDIFKGIISVIGQMFGASGKAAGGVLGLAAKVGQLITNIKNAIERGTAFTKFFQVLGTVLSAPVKIIGNLIAGFDSFISMLGRALNALKPFIEQIQAFFGRLGSAIADSIRSGNFSQVMAAINSVLLGGVFLAIRKFFSTFTKKLGPGLGFVESIKSIFSGLTSSLQALQTNLNAGTLRKIAISIALLTASLVALSLIDPKKLASSLTAMTVMFGQLVSAMALLSKITPLGIINMFALGAGLDMLAGAMLVLAGAVLILSRLSWGELVKGLSGIAVSLGLLIGAVKLLSKGAPGLFATAAAMVAIALALNILAAAVGILGNMDWSTLIKGTGAIAALLAIMAGFNKFGGAQLISTAAAMLVLGAALNVIAAAVRILGTMSIENLAKGLLAVGAALVIIAAGMTLMPPTMFATAAGLLVVAAALTILAGALKIMGGMSWEDIAQSLIVLAGALVILSAAMILMSGGLAGAAALVVIAAGLALLVPPLIALSALSWGQLLTALAALAGILLVLGVAALVLGPLAPALLAVGAALLVFSAAVLAVGAGVALLGVGLTAIGLAVTTAGGAILGFVKGILSLIPYAMQQIGIGIINLAKAISNGGAAIINAFSAILSALLKAVIRNMPLIGQAMRMILTLILSLINQYGPQIINTFIRLVLSLLNAIASRVGQFVSAGIKIILGFLNGIAQNIGRVISTAVSVIVAFLNGISANLGRIIDAGIRLAISFVNGVANGIRNNTGQIRAAAYNVGSAIIEGAIAGVSGLVGGLIGAVVGAAKSAIGAMWNAIKGGSPSRETMLVGASMMQGLVIGMRKNQDSVNDAADEAGKNVLKALQESLSKVASGLGDDIHPTITPVLDLSDVKKGFDDIVAMGQGINPTFSKVYADLIAYAGTPVEAQASRMFAGGNYVTFTQNNTSPKALSAADIYRQTKNQLSQMKGRLP